MFLRKNSLWTLCIGLSVLSSGCNFFGTTDSPTDTTEKKSVATVDANNGDCGVARNILIGIPANQQTDDSYAALGWAQLCISGATASNIASSLYSFTSSSTDLTIIGTLARSMLPMTDEKLAEAQNAMGTFNNIRDDKTRNLQVAIAKIVRASALIAARYTNGTNSDSLQQDDIAPSACSAVDSACAAAAGVCTAGMSDSHVSDVITLLSEASTNLSTAGASDLKTLADTILSGLSTGGDVGRCYIYKNLIPSN